MSETEISHGGGESPTKPISGAKIREQLQNDAYLEKPYQHQNGQQAMEQALKECNVPAGMAQQLAKRGRINMHLIRMLRRSEAERNFSLAYLRHRDDIFEEDQEGAESIRMVIGSEGEDTKMFWTFAPYLFKALIEKGISEKDAISKILSWSKDGVSTFNESTKPKGYAKRDSGHTHLKGLEKCMFETIKTWVLDPDPNHISHRYTEQEAERIADLLINEGVEKTIDERNR